MSQYKYYFKKPRSEIVKDILKWLAVAGVVSIAATSPYFILNVIKALKNSKKYKKKKIYDTFYRLQKEGCIDIEKEGGQIYINLPTLFFDINTSLFLKTIKSIVNFFLFIFFTIFK